MAKYTRTHHAPARPSFVAIVLNYLSYLVLFAVCGVMLFLAWPLVQAQIAGIPQAAPSAPLAQPTALIAPRSLPAAQPAFQAVPTASLAQIEATSMAVYQATVQAVNAASVPLPNVDTTGDTTPPILVSRPAEERQAAGENVPTAEPIAPAESGGIFGSKPAIVAPQESHECKHGQVWIDGKGCKNPTPVGAP